MAPALPRLKPKQKLSTQVVDAIEAAILDGRFGLDERLPTEAQLCERLGVSRTALREALQHLKSRGLIESVAGRGMFLRPLNENLLERDLSLFARLGEHDPAVFVELLDLRLQIEPECARAAAKSAQEAGSKLIADLKALLAEMEDSLDDLERFIHADLSMHVRIAEESGNRFYRLILSCLKPMGDRYGLASYRSPQHMRQTLREHRQLVAHLQAGRSREAATAMRRHLADSKQRFLSLP